MACLDQLVLLSVVSITLWATAVNTKEVIKIAIHSNTTSLDITACSGRRDYQLSLVDVPMSWFDATETCRLMKFAGILYARSNWQKRRQVREYLARIDYNGLNYTFWFGDIRPHMHVRKWYHYTNKKCFEVANRHLTVTGNFTDGQCSVIRRDKTVPVYNERLAIENCTQTHPFVCFKVYGNISFYEYDGFKIDGEPLDGVLDTWQNFTFDQCLSTCFEDIDCLAFTFNSEIDECAYLFRNSSSGISLNYTLIRHPNVTHYAKGNCNLEIRKSSSIPTVANVSQTVPNCGIDKIPAGYLPCNETNIHRTCRNTYMEQQHPSETELEEMITELIENLTVSKKSTAINKRKKLSAPDERKSSKAFGVVGITFLVCTFALFPLCDIFVPKKKMKKATKKSSRTTNEKNTS